MNTGNRNILKQLLNTHVPETVYLASSLEEKGISNDLQQYYKKSGWLTSIGTGAFKRPNENIDWKGCLHALQEDLKLPVHAGGLTTLSLLGYSHFIRLGGEMKYIFAPLNTNSPQWFKNYMDGDIVYVKTSFLPSDIGFIDYDNHHFKIKISSMERAILECLYLAPLKMDLVECFYLMEGLGNITPKRMQVLLENCNSIKVKRLFFYMAEKAGHLWLPDIDRSKITLGVGPRNLIKSGVYIPKYQITVPSELSEL